MTFWQRLSDLIAVHGWRVVIDPAIAIVVAIFFFGSFCCLWWSYGQLVAGLPCAGALRLSC